MNINMITAALRRVYRTSDKLIIRNLRGGTRYVPRGPNPGLDNRIRAFEKDGLQISDEDAEEFVEQSESDFYKVGEAYNEHLNETLIGKYEVQHHIIKEKYFKENMPNLLTWSEKEQIRYLAEEFAEEWTPEKLAESFPVTVPVVKKLLKYKWKPATKERIARHDESVMRNWRELKEGSLDIPNDLREQFLKFSNRTIPPLNEKSIAPTIEFTKEEKLGEFAKIVQKCAAQENSSRTSSETNEQINYEGPERVRKEYVKKDSKYVTLNELTEKLKKRLDTGKEVDVPDKLMLHAIESKNDIHSENINSEIELSHEDIEEKKLTAFKDEEKKDNNIMDYPERIRIPKSAYKKGATYKVNDCYYDHDGKFLYRVLGMSN